MTLDQGYSEKGYCLVKHFIHGSELVALREIALRCHASWITTNQAFYRTGAVNAAYLTNGEHINEVDRLTLFKLIASKQIQLQIQKVFGHPPAFMNTQLFFNPNNKKQKNYWHRDSQYHLNIEQQKRALQGADVVHFRIALNDEPGIEVVPKSHKNWHTEEELSVRMQTNGRVNSDELSSGRLIPLHAGDLLIFSANMIHRGVYGLDRLSLDILLCDAVPELLEFAQEDCLPQPEVSKYLNHPEVFELTSKLKNNH
ncbi:phytanoyl-CoA dioxygenase family protein [Paraglaciecola chathamensis]|uniref:phytanoyl-CoA dioxygenase family protein n=1 Tax=Paraglaciecola chathamensis TaxID=368405 RepID=UPI0026F65AB9|nr:phytanoyl-CoA dioxygenase family protein [Paraglaciecola chathamensis]MDO6837995.1 phytanoyl-CoA dioxygenase family protein [Paraglaciecola chathamensis]